MFVYNNEITTIYLNNKIPRKYYTLVISYLHIGSYIFPGMAVPICSLLKA